MRWSAGAPARRSSRRTLSRRAGLGLVPGGGTVLQPIERTGERVCFVPVRLSGSAVRRSRAGPGRPAPDVGVDILLVPVHPQTGQTWIPTGPAASAYPVPLPLGVWLWLVSPQPCLPVPVSGGVPQDVLRDDPLPPRPNCLFRAERGTFQHTLVRLRARSKSVAAQDPWEPHAVHVRRPLSLGFFARHRLVGRCAPRSRRRQPEVLHSETVVMRRITLRVLRVGMHDHERNGLSLPWHP